MVYDCLGTVQPNLLYVLPVFSISLGDFQSLKAFRYSPLEIIKDNLRTFFRFYSLVAKQLQSNDIIQTTLHQIYIDVHCSILHENENKSFFYSLTLKYMHAYTICMCIFGT